MQLNAKMRRYIFIRTKMLGYSTQEWGKLHALVTDDSIRETFWMLLRSRNVSHIHPGTVPENDFMATAVAESAPEAISNLKHLCLATPEDLQPRDGQGLYANSSAALPHAVASQPDALVLKERADGTPASMLNLLGAELEDSLLEQDFAVSHARRNGSTAAVNSYIRVPTGHLMGCIARSIQGQRFTTTNEANFKRDLANLGLVIGVPRLVAGVKVKSTVQLPTIQGLRWMIKKAGYMTDDEIAQADAPYAD